MHMCRGQPLLSGLLRKRDKSYLLGQFGPQQVLPPHVLSREELSACQCFLLPPTLPTPGRSWNEKMELSLGLNASCFAHQTALVGIC